MDYDFSWAPSGKAIYFERTFRGARNLWKITVDHDTLQATAIERLTTGPGLDTQLAVSADGTKLAFTGGDPTYPGLALSLRRHSRPSHRCGPGRDPPGAEAWRPSLSRDGKKLAFCSVRAGKWEVWEKSLSDGREAPIVADDLQA